MKRAATLVLALFAGCAVPGDSTSDPLQGIRVVAVLPFSDRTGGSSFDADEFANILASELVKIGGVRVIRPAQIRASAEPGEPIVTVDDAIRIGRRVRADAVLACAITDYDPYDPPKVAIAAQLFRVASGPLTGGDLDRLLQSASWRNGPLKLSKNRAGHAMAAFEEVYDAHDVRTRRALQAYVRGRMSGERDYLAVQSKYLQFVSSEVIHRALEILASHGS